MVISLKKKYYDTFNFHTFDNSIIVKTYNLYFMWFISCSNLHILLFRVGTCVSSYRVRTYTSHFYNRVGIFTSHL